MKTLHSLFSFLAFLGLGSSAFADFITGHVVDSSGVPVAGMNIDAIRVSNGNNIHITNDGTDAAGFFLTTLPADVYDLWFFPPAPPQNSHVTLVLRNVVVVGTKDLGTLHLQAGAVLSGHLQTESGFPVSTLDLWLTDNLTGQSVPLTNRRTDAFGNFLVAVPKNSIELDLDATSVLPLFVLGSKALFLSPTGDTSLGTIVLPQGYAVTGHVQRTTGGAAVSGVDLDFKDLATGATLYTPNDNSDPLGNFSVVVPAGNYHVDFAAPFATQLVGKRLVSQAVSASTALGTVTLDNGVVLSGTIKSFDNVNQVNADVDVYLQSTGTLIPTASDNSSASGAYQVIVPLDNLRIIYRPPGYDALVSDVHTNVLVSANLTLNGVLPAWAGANNYGAGLAGTGGIVPHVTVSGGTSRSGNPDFALELQAGRGGSLTVVVISILPFSAPLFGGTLLVKPGSLNAVSMFLTLGGAAGAAGAGTKHLPLPFAIGRAEGFDLYTQFAVRDLAAPRGWSLSDAVHFKVVP